MNWMDHLHSELEKLNLLKHPFYTLWQEGRLPIEAIAYYAKEYYHHVAAFPRYISGLHTQSDDIHTRQILLDNLVDEERGPDNHPALWRRFAEACGVEEADFAPQPERTETQLLVDGYFDLVNEGFATGMGALYAYERQTPAVSASKKEGLQQFYGITDEAQLAFFTVHMTADEWHTEECAGIMRHFEPADADRALDGALRGARMLWTFLDGMLAHYQQTIAANPQAIG